MIGRLLVCCLALSWLVAGCSDAHLYGKGGEDPAANRLGLTGRVCTEDAREAGFPVKVIFLVDTANGPMISEFDLEQARLRALNDALSVHAGNESFSFAIAAFGGTARLLAPTDGYFTRNPGELDAAVSTLALPQGCINGECRDYGAGLDLVQSLVEGDLADLTPGERSRTQYVVVLLTGGPPSPLACEQDCCDADDDGCDDGRCTESWECSGEQLVGRVHDLGAEVEARGALSLTLHTLFLAAPDSSVSSPETELDRTADLLEDMTLEGAGLYQRFDVADAVTLDRVGLLKLSSLLDAKALIAVNMSTLPSADGPIADSDGDGLSDSAERELGTSPTAADTDGDGLGDLVEALVSLDPLLAEGEVDACKGLDPAPWGDADIDLLNDCEELLLGTQISLPDTDGDALTDWMEVRFGTDYLHADALDDSDWDGTTNGDEALTHTDPRSSDVNSHLADAYRYDVTDEGTVVEASLGTPHDIEGVDFIDAGADTTGGLGAMRYVADDPPTLAWRDPSDDEFGPAVAIAGSGIVELSSSSVDGAGLERWIQVDVEPVQLPPGSAEELLLVDLSERQCLSFTVRNITLVETAAGEGAGGQNDVFLYLAEAPQGRLTLPGLYRALHVPVVYHAESGRVPSEPLLEVGDAEFAAIGQ